MNNVTTVPPMTMQMQAPGMAPAMMQPMMGAQMYNPQMVSRFAKAARSFTKYLPMCLRPRATRWACSLWRSPPCTANRRWRCDLRWTPAMCNSLILITRSDRWWVQSMADQRIKNDWFLDKLLGNWVKLTYRDWIWEIINAVLTRTCLKSPLGIPECRHN